MLIEMKIAIIVFLESHAGEKNSRDSQLSRCSDPCNKLGYHEYQIYLETYIRWINIKHLFVDIWK